MDQIKKLETIVGNWLKPLPDIPLAAKKWIAENIWWLAIISLVASIISAITLIFGIISYSAATATINTYSYYVHGLQYSTTWLTGALVDLVVLVLTIVITASAIKLLQDLRYRGWFLLFLLLVLSAIHTVVGAIVSLNVGVFLLDIVFGAIVLFIAAYLLFQIRGQFGVAVHRSARRATIVKR
jgi:uncharacterized membrane protein YfcA